MRVAVSLQVDEELVRLSITDDGRGIDSPKSKGMGMRTMRHRADAIGASFAVHPLPAGGTEIICERGNRSSSADGETFTSV